VDDYLARMQNAAARMQAMINGLLDLSRVNARGGEFTLLNTTQLVEEVVSDLETRIEAANGQVKNTELPPIQADAVQMRQLFQNLIGNAIKFHRPGTPPVVRISGQTDRRKQPPVIEIRVEDNGIGFDPQYSEQIFQPFKRLHGRTEYEGTGLGLAICKKIVERHNGTIHVHSVSGEGTVFTVRLPAAEA
jgi:signal transduction histidine kinase